MAFIQTFTVAAALLFLGSKVQGNLYQLCEQLDFYGNLTPFLDCLEYNRYGCWCGYGGSGTPVDEIDSCCKAHDACYGNVKKQHAIYCSPYFATYKYDNGKCLDTSHGCDRATCECDNALAKCAADKMYEMKFKNYRSTGRCGNRRK